MLPTCEKCGAPVDVGQYSIAGRRLCNNCLASEYGTITGVQSTKYSLGIPTASGTIDATISGLEKGIFDIDKVSTVDFRDEQIAKLGVKIEELERAGHEDKEELESYKQRLALLEKRIHAPGSRKVARPSFSKLCEILVRWFPRRVRKYEESYKAELAEYLSHFSPKVREETEGQLCDILVSNQYPIHLKVDPNKSQYDTLCGQIFRTLETYKHVACVVIGISASDQYHDFIERVAKSAGTSKIRFFPKAR